jgi:hypothetical protein
MPQDPAGAAGRGLGDDSRDGDAFGDESLGDGDRAGETLGDKACDEGDALGDRERAGEARAGDCDEDVFGEGAPEIIALGLTLGSRALTIGKEDTTGELSICKALMKALVKPSRPAVPYELHVALAQLPAAQSTSRSSDQ